MFCELTPYARAHLAYRSCKPIHFINDFPQKQKNKGFAYLRLRPVGERLMRVDPKTNSGFALYK